jgi:hypothetical protein
MECSNDCWPMTAPTSLTCLGCRAMGVIAWDGPDTVGKVAGDFHVETGRAKKPLIVCTLCDMIYGPLPDRPQP